MVPWLVNGSLMSLQRKLGEDRRRSTGSPPAYAGGSLGFDGVPSNLRTDVNAISATYTSTSPYPSLYNDRQNRQNDKAAKQADYNAKSADAATLQALANSTTTLTTVSAPKSIA